MPPKELAYKNEKNKPRSGLWRYCMSKEAVLNKIKDVGIVAVIRAESVEQAAKITDACVAGGVTTWHGYARFVLGEAQAAGVPLKAGPQAVEAVPTSTARIRKSRRVLRRNATKQTTI